MGLYLNQNNIMFQEAVNSEIYIDKTLLIKELNKIVCTSDKYVCISRPRRFGKSIAANMITAYYSKGCDSKELFAPYKISQTETFEKHLNKYNVISFDMQKFLVNTKSVEEMLEEMEEEILDELLMEYPELEKYKRLNISKAVGKIFASTGVPFVFIIDEWDCVLRYYSSESEQKKYLDYLYALFKDQPYVALAYMTGILPIKKYGVHSALNMFNEYSMEGAYPFSEFTGFTEQETEALCLEYNIDLNEAKKWYNGYNVDDIAIYNPRSVTEACRRKRFTNYWSKTETYNALKTPISLNFDGLKEKVKKMIAGDKIGVNTAKFQNDMTSMKSADDILTLLIHLGYLTYDFNTKSCHIPNMEVQQEFINCIEDGGWEQVMNAINQSEECLKATLSGDEETVARIVEQTHQENTSIIKYNDENALACVVTLAFYTARNQYEIIRELPTGKGYADIAFLPRPNESVPAIVVELKREQDTSIALEQIKNRQYAEKLLDYSGEIILVGINYTTDPDTDYKKHTCKIERIVK
ncbi:MAG: AAA family ATPase [Oscillospiraceae bacterium]|nr:AAA family ATPase [Oscillospiraceae bacterium]